MEDEMLALFCGDWLCQQCKHSHISKAKRNKSAKIESQFFFVVSKHASHSKDVLNLAPNTS